MNEMVERVANAFWQHMTFGGNSAHFSAQPKQITDHYRQAARLAIEAMKEPTDRMLRHVPFQSNEPPIDTYQRIIQAALDDV